MTLPSIFRDWDAIRPTSECLHCKGSGIAPGDGRTECGFCDERPAPRTIAEHHKSHHAIKARRRVGRWS